VFGLSRWRHQWRDQLDAAFLDRSHRVRPVKSRPGAPSSDWLHELAVSRDIVANSSVEYQKWGGQIA
jgi:hypothetical protein